MERSGVGLEWCRRCNLRIWILTVVATCFAVCSQVSPAASDYANRTEVARILSGEKFEVVKHVIQISPSEWARAGVMPQGRSIAASMVDPGKAYESSDFGTGKLPARQLLLAAKNTRYEVLCFWEGTVGGPMLKVMMIRRDIAKPRLLFDAIMNNDIPQNRWTWEEVKRHIRENKMDVLISAEHPGTFDNRLP